jgi:hypothetical protein
MKYPCVLPAVVVGALLLGYGNASAALAGDAALPELSRNNAAALSGREARLEIGVVEVKYAQRRKTHFLSASPNFRAPDNLPVAIRAGDLDKFHQAGIKDLAAEYLNREIRARGLVVQDEGQWLLVVESPDQIEVLQALAAPAAETRLVIVDESGKPTELAVPLPADLPRAEYTFDHDGEKQTFSAVPLGALFERAAIVVGDASRGRLLGRYVLVTGRDGYTVAFSLAELDAYFANKPPLLAEQLNGGSLPDNRVPLQVVMPLDNHRRRWVGQVVRIEVHHALPVPRAEQPQ